MDETRDRWTAASGDTAPTTPFAVLGTGCGAALWTELIAIAAGAICGAEFLLVELGFRPQPASAAGSPVAVKDILNGLTAGAFGGGFVGAFLGVPFVFVALIRAGDNGWPAVQLPLAIACGTVAAHSAAAAATSHFFVLVAAALAGGFAGGLWFAHASEDPVRRWRTLLTLGVGAALCAAATLALRVLYPPAL